MRQRTDEFSVWTDERRDFLHETHRIVIDLASGQEQDSRPLEAYLGVLSRNADPNDSREMNQVTNHNAKHALLMEAGAGLCAVNTVVHANGPCGTWSYVSFDMLRTELVTMLNIYGDPGSGG